jgi:hypothetical protein
MKIFGDAGRGCALGLKSSSQVENWFKALQIEDLN